MAEETQRLKPEWVEHKLNSLEEKLNRILNMLEKKSKTEPVQKKEKLPAQDFRYREDDDGRIVLISRDEMPVSVRDLVAGERE